MAIFATLTLIFAFGDDILVYERRRGQPSASKKSGLKILIVELEEVFDSYADVAARIGGNPGAVYKCLSDNYPLHETHKGYHFEWTYDENGYFWD